MYITGSALCTDVGQGSEKAVLGNAGTTADNLSSQHISTLDGPTRHALQLTGLITDAGQAQELRLGGFLSA